MESEKQEPSPQELEASLSMASSFVISGTKLEFLKL
jgi:hypothetical protein